MNTLWADLASLVIKVVAAAGLALAGLSRRRSLEATYSTRACTPPCACCHGMDAKGRGKRLPKRWLPLVQVYATKSKHTSCRAVTSHHVRDLHSLPSRAVTHTHNCTSLPANRRLDSFVRARHASLSGATMAASLVMASGPHRAQLTWCSATAYGIPVVVAEVAARDTCASRTSTIQSTMTHDGSGGSSKAEGGTGSPVQHTT